MSSIWNDLLFLHGHIADANLARRLAAARESEHKPRKTVARKEKAPRKRPAELARIAPCGGGACTPT